MTLTLFYRISWRTMHEEKKPAPKISVHVLSREAVF